MTRRIFLMILVIASLALVSAALAGEESTAEETYIVLYNRSAVPDDAAETMARKSRNNKER